MNKRRGVDVKTVVVAVVASVITGMTIPAVSAVVDAVNADKVDERHAVGVKSSVDNRAGKLVATGKNGRLPNNIIAKAPNAARLGGMKASNFLHDLGPARDFIAGGSCDPGADTDYETCATVRLSVPRTGRVMLTLDASWRTQSAPSSGRCRFFGPGTSNEQVEFGEPTDSNTSHNFGFNEVTKRLSAGERIFGFECREFDGDTIVFRDRMMSAVFVGGL